MKIEKYSIGVGDRFGFEGAAQLRALQKAAGQGMQIVPVWNKSNREHTLIGTSPDNVRKSASAAVETCGWTSSYYVDADHIGVANVDKFLAASDFFTIDVADYIGKPSSDSSIEAFVKAMSRFSGKLSIPGIGGELTVTREMLADVAGRYLGAIEEAGKVYRYIAGKKGEDDFVTEVSVDEAALPQTPIELFFILAALADAHVPVQTIAPKFTGSFLKGIDYVGDIDRFTREFEDDLAVVAYAVKNFGLPDSLKLSIHSGSDKFSLYPVMHRLTRKHDAGLHLKTAGTTWLEEVIGLAASGGEGLQIAKDIYAESFQRFDELAKPYLPVIDIDRSKLPQPAQVATWTSEEFVEALRHNQSCRRYSIHVRQLVHIGFRVAAEMGERYRSLLRTYRGEIEANVTTNLYDRHIMPLFLGLSNSGLRPDVVEMTAGGPSKL